jgi:glycosyl transferase family 25
MDNSFNLNNFVDKVYVLSVKSFKDRIHHIKKEMGRHNIQFEFVFDYDVPELTPALLKKHFAPSSLTLAQKSLVLKHRHAWQDALKNKYQRVLIFEDDVILLPNFNQHFKVLTSTIEKLPKDYLIFFGGSDTKVPNHFFLEKGLLVKHRIATAEAYLVDLANIKRRMSWLNKHRIDLPADHLMAHMDCDLHHANHYWVKKPLVEQGSVTGLFVSKLDAHRLKHSIYFNILRYRWNKFQRRTLKSLFVKCKFFLLGS